MHLPPVLQASLLGDVALLLQALHHGRHRGQRDVQLLGDFGDGAAPVAAGADALDGPHLRQAQLAVGQVRQDRLFDLARGAVGVHQQAVQLVAKSVHAAGLLQR